MGGCCIMDNFIGDFFSDLFGGGGGCSYHPQSMEDEKHAKKIADELAEMKENMRKSSEQTEEKIMEWVSKSTVRLLQELEKVNGKNYGGKVLELNIKGIQNENKKLMKEVKGHIGNVMDERLVLTDKELSGILAERKDEKRHKNFDKFVLKLKREAVISLKSKIENTVQKQSEMIEKEINARLKEVNSSVQAKGRAYSEMLKSKRKDEESLKKSQIKYMYKKELYQLLYDNSDKV